MLVLHLRLGKGSGNRRTALAARFARALTKGHRGGFAEMQHLAGVRLGDADEAETTKHARRAKALIQRLIVMQAVENRQQRGVLAHRRRNRLDGTIQVVSLAAQQDQIERLCPRQLISRKVPDHQLRIAQRTADNQPMGVQLRGASRAHQEGYVQARLRQPAAEIAARTTRAENQDTHRSSPFAQATTRRRTPSAPTSTKRSADISGIHSTPSGISPGWPVAKAITRAPAA
jgi:hypothetical protein